MNNLILQIFFQLATGALAFIIASLDYETTDKRTKTNKNLRRWLPVLIVFSVALGISLSIYEFCSKDKDLKEQRARYQAQIELLTQTNNLAYQSIDSIKSVLKDTDTLYKTLTKSSSKLINISHKISTDFNDQSHDLSNNSLIIDFELEARKVKGADQSKGRFMFIPLKVRSLSYRL